DAGPRSNQRLEFLGDRVLGLAVAAALHAEFPDAPEGELSLRLARLVRKETCAEVALGWDVGPALKLGAGEARAGGRRKTAILADACEALIGAVFVDAGFEAARRVTLAAFGPRLHGADAAARDPKTALQEWAQARGLPAPRYSEADRSGPAHAPRFVVRVDVEGAEPAFGEAANKRAAEQAAARAALTREGLDEGYAT
ncbi:MAG: ribonuclease III, partial [Hyphomicrobiales bacterium]|nr:ribonuclease III [Hyphomicrobiales bacterium]